MGKGVDFDVRAWRDRMNITNVFAAELIDCTTRSFSRWLAGRVKPDPYSVRQMQRLEERKQQGLPLRDIRPGLFSRRRPKPSKSGAAPGFGARRDGSPSRLVSPL
jgi:hypothetical protein